MESISSGFSPSSAPASFRWTKKIAPVRRRPKESYFRRFSVVVKWKKDSYQDFQGYAKPLQLLPASGAKISTTDSSEQLVELFPLEDHESLYKLKLQTSKMYGSELTDLNAGVLLCCIGENGSSILQRLPALDSARMEVHHRLHFERGSVDEFVFKGPNLGRIAAVWIGLESGQWRLGGMNLKILSDVSCEDDPLSATKNHENKFPASLCHHFEIDDILIGGKSENSMMEFRPISVTDFSEDSLLDDNSSSASNEESMKEYADLKFSLLLYDAVLVLCGASIISFAAGNNALYSFLGGGLAGFIYLFLLERSVDGLPALNLIHGEKKTNFIQVLEKLRVPIAALALASTFVIITMKHNYTPAEDGFKLTPEDLISGILGFLLCKVAVILAAFKPIQLGIKDTKKSP